MNIKTAGTGTLLLSFRPKIITASSSVGWAFFYLCSEMKIRTIACCCFWKDNMASTFKFYWFLFNGVTTVMLDSYEIRWPSR